ncbi:hypothetical protein [Halogeometricum luteum]|uniref:Uncharacterized protein n=1 Tax=Halogeometricum luteum TaxID=2950537 RepID=A0ABU2G0B0_9EURY|nr:hypothetical protein [Halogeometricum sp. S3BR5-2]MDS0293679.1 hypothetical protein [Halogeometricum sp. S3BR5-2]
MGTYLLRRFYGGVVDGVLTATDAAVPAGDRAALALALEEAAETATRGAQREFLAALSPAQRELLTSVFDVAVVQAQRETLLLLTLFVLVVLLVSTLLPNDGSDADS